MSVHHDHGENGQHELRTVARGHPVIGPGALDIVRGHIGALNELNFHRFFVFFFFRLHTKSNSYKHPCINVRTRERVSSYVCMYLCVCVKVYIT